MLLGNIAQQRHSRIMGENMKIDYKIFFASISCGVIFWLLSTFIWYALYYKRSTTYINLLIRGMPEHGTYLVLMIFGLFAVFGIIMSRIVSQLEKSEKNLKIKNHLLNKIMDSLTYPFIVIDINNYQIKMANSSAYTIGAKSKDTCYSLICNNDKPCSQFNRPCLIDEVKKTKKPMVIEHLYIDADGSSKSYEIHGFPILDDNDNIIQIIEYWIDISSYKQAKKYLENERERSAVTLRSIGDGVIVTDIDGKISLINSVAEKLTGWNENEALGKDLDDVFIVINDQTREKHGNIAKKVLDTGKVITLTNNLILISKDKTEYVIKDSGAPIKDKEENIIGVVIVFTDITIDQKIDIELQRIERLESIGILASGIAHDFNNILTSILGNISLASMSTDIEKIQRRLHNAENSCIKARDLTRQLLIFSKGGVPAKKTELISDFIKESAIFALSGSNIKAKFQISEDLLPVSIDEALINQVINNIIINAIQSMPNGGVIKIYAENLELDDNSGLPLNKGNYIKISIEDQGSGISKDDLQKIFDPYCASTLKGYSLGLAVSYSIVKRHDGHISVESVFGKGTTFHVYLPISDSIVSKNDMTKTNFNL